MAAFPVNLYQLVLLCSSSSACSRWEWGFVQTSFPQSNHQCQRTEGSTKCQP